MAENLTIARPYAQAVFEIAQADQTFDQWSQSLEALAVAVQNEQVQAMLAQASTNEAGAKLLIELLGDLIDQKGQNFVYVVGENNRFAVLPEIFEEFVRLRDDYLKSRSWNKSIKPQSASRRRWTQRSWAESSFVWVMR